MIMHAIRSFLLVILLLPSLGKTQTLIDSIPYPGVSNLNFWGIHVTPDTIFLGADGPGPIYFSDHDGGLMGHVETGYTYNHGLIKRESSYLFAQQYASAGALLHEVDLNGELINEWAFPPGVLGNSSGIGDLNEAGDGAIWFTVYHPQSDVYPFTYAYKWMPGSNTLLDTVPLLGKQPYGITVKGDTLLYVIDRLQGDTERIYAYDLTNQQDLFSLDLPDTQFDNQNRPRGLHWDGNHLYLVADRQGGSAWSYQTVFIYSMDISVGMGNVRDAREVQIYPNPAMDLITIELPGSVGSGTTIQFFDAQGRLVHEERSSGLVQRIPVNSWQAGLYFVRVLDVDRIIAQAQISVIK